ncbi:MAG: organomercurial lyase, partial [Gemmatimonadales bacterium]
VKVTIYRTTAETGTPPSAAALAARMGVDAGATKDAYARLRAKRMLLLNPDGETIRFAPPFSGVPTQHRVTVGDVDYYAPCAWDALGIGAALHRPALVQSECAESHEPLRLNVGVEGPEPSSWLFHCLVPAARWWDDLVFT